MLICAAGVAVFLADRAVQNAAEHRLYTRVEDLPHRHTGLLLGTAPTSGAYQNWYFRYRVEAAAELLRRHAIDVLLISGDNSRNSYDEPTAMRDSLVAKGIDSNRIVLDYAGFRTFDSIVRVKEVFSQDSIVVISQAFHNARALYIAQQEGIDAIGFNAQEVDPIYGPRIQIREKFARLKTILDFYIGTRPHFLGPKVSVP